MKQKQKLLEKSKCMTPNSHNTIPGSGIPIRAMEDMLRLQPSETDGLHIDGEFLKDM